MARTDRIRRYFSEYELADILTMIRNNKAEPKRHLGAFTDRLVVITGATSGIGRATAREYAAHGARLLCINRNAEKSHALCEELASEFGVECRSIIADFSKLGDVHRAGAELAALSEPIDVLIHNAGTYLTRRVETEDGLEAVFAVNHLASFVITYLVREKLLAQESGRVLLVNSEAHRFAPWGLHMDDLGWERRRYSGLGGYGSAKLAQLLAMMQFDQMFDGSPITINAVHPGAVRTESGKENGAFYKWYKTRVIERTFRSAQISADALYYLGASPDVGDVSGKFFNLTTVEKPAPPALDAEAADVLWNVSRALGRLD